MQRVAIIGGCRTPFVKAGTVFSEFSFLDLAKHVVAGTIEKINLDPNLIDELIFSTVLLDPRYPNAAREIVLRTNLPKSLSAHFISNNCISGLVALNFVADGIKSGRIGVGLAGGSESMSNPSLTINRKAEKFFIGLAKARSLNDKLKLLTTFRPGFLMPQPPSPKEPSTGLTMGQHCEISAKEFSVSRAEQDRIAFASHQNAVRAEEAGYLAEEILSLSSVSNDNIIRKNTSLEKLSKLRPVFDKSEKGSITAGNASSLTDGASSVALASESRAKEIGAEILGYIDHVEFAGIDPKDGLLMAPGLAVPKLLKKANLSISDIDFFEIHEAFGAQVAANKEIWKNGWDKFPDLKPIGEIPEDKINVNGGSIAIGHPFAATGGRLVLSAANHLKRTGKNKTLISVCAAGAMACAMIVSRE